MKVLKAGVMAGVVGIALLFVNIFIEMVLAIKFLNSGMLFISFIAEISLFALPGILAGVLASRYVKSTNGSLLPGLIAGTIMALAELLELFSFIFPVIGGQAGASIIWITLPVVLIRAPFLIVLSGLSSALAIFFTRELYWSIPVPNNDRNSDELKTLYDELWADARTMVVDMNRSIRIYLFAGILMLIFGLAILGSGVVGWQHIRSVELNLPNSAGYSAAPSDYLIVICEFAGGLFLLLTGPYLLYWYYKLKKRYARLMVVEKTLGA